MAHACTLVKLSCRALYSGIACRSSKDNSELRLLFPPQVHKAVLREGGRSRVVAVKVRHPGVASRIKQDFQLLIPLARYTSRFKSLKVRLLIAGTKLPCVWPYMSRTLHTKGLDQLLLSLCTRRRACSQIG